MPRTLFIALLLLLSPLLRGQSVGLVLDGGGARGIAHIGLIQALEEHNIPIDYVAGTSIGAIVGALYAMGYTPEEMMKLVSSEEFRAWQSGVINDKDIYYFKKPDPTPTFGTIRISFGESNPISANILPKSLIKAAPMNFGFMKIFGAYSGAINNDFNQLMIPYRAVAADIDEKRAMVISSGDFSDAVRGSMSFPFVFKPIRINDKTIYDGGIYNNFPLDVMKSEFNPDFIIGSSVSLPKQKSTEENMVSQLEKMIIQRSEYHLPQEEGIIVKHITKGVALLDFEKAKHTYQIGYNCTLQMIDSIMQRIPRRVTDQERADQRAAFRSKVPELHFDKVTVTGVTPLEQKQIKKIFDPKPGKTKNIREVRKDYYRALSDGKIKDLLPHARYNPQSGKFELELQTEVTKHFGLNLGGYLTSNNANLIYIGIEYSSLGLYSLDASLSVQLGQNYLSSETALRIDLPTSTPSYLKWNLIYSKQEYFQNNRLFYSTNTPVFITHEELFTKLHYGFPLFGTAKGEISGGIAELNDYYYSNQTIDFAQTERTRSRYHLAAVSFLLENNTLNTRQYPTRGNKTSIIGQGIIGKGETSSYTNELRPVNNNEPHISTLSSKWLQIKGSIEHYFPLHKHIVLGVRGEGVFSTKELLSGFSSTLIEAPVFAPTLYSKTIFNESFRANQYIAAGILPIFKFNEQFHFRSEFYLFAAVNPFEKKGLEWVSYGPAFSTLAFMGEAAFVYSFPFATASIYANYLNAPTEAWSIGISFGVLLYNPTFLLQ